MPASLAPHLTAADLMHILEETLHEVLTGEIGTAHASPVDSPTANSSPVESPAPADPVDQPAQPRKTDTGQMRAAVTSSPVPEKLTRREFDLLDD